MLESLVDLDQRLSTAFYQGWAALHIPEFITLWLALYLIYAVPVVLIGLWFRKANHRAAFLGGLAGILAWLGVGNLIGSLYFRHRPFDRSDIEVQELFFHRPDKSFPSDHAVVSFAIAAIFFFERQYLWAAVFFLLGLVTGLARVGAGLHFLGDLSGALPAAMVAALIIWLVRRRLTSKVLPAFERLLQPLRLA